MNLAEYAAQIKAAPEKHQSDIRMVQSVFTWFLSLHLSQCWSEESKEDAGDRHHLHLFLTNESSYDFKSFAARVKVEDADGNHIETKKISADDWRKNADHEFDFDVDKKCKGLSLEMIKEETVPVKSSNTPDKELSAKVSDKKAAFLSILDKGINTADDKAIKLELLTLRSHSVTLFNHFTENPAHYPQMEKLCDIYGQALENAILANDTGKAEANLNAVTATGINRMQTLLSHFKAGDIDSVDTDLEVLKYMI